MELLNQLQGLLLDLLPMASCLQGSVIPGIIWGAGFLATDNTSFEFFVICLWLPLLAAKNLTDLGKKKLEGKERHLEVQRNF